MIGYGKSLVDKLLGAFVVLCICALLPVSGDAQNPATTSCEQSREVPVLLARQLFESTSAAPFLIRMFAHYELFQAPLVLIPTGELHNPHCEDINRTANGYLLTYVFDWRPIPSQKMTFSIDPRGNFVDLVDEQEPNHTVGLPRYKAMQDLLDKGKDKFVESLKRDEKHNDPISEAFLQYLISKETEPIMNGAPRIFLRNALLAAQDQISYGNPPHEAIDTAHKYVAQAAFEYIVIEPDQAARVLRKAPVDLSGAIEAERQLQRDSFRKMGKDPVFAGERMMVPIGKISLTPVLDINAADFQGSDRRSHFATTTLPANYQVDRGGPIAVLTQSENGKFALIPEGDIGPDGSLFPTEKLASPKLPKAAHFEGSADAFSKVLPGYIAAAASAIEQNPSKFDKDIEFLTKVVQACANLTPQKLRKVFTLGQLGHPYSDCETGPIGLRTEEGKKHDSKMERVLIYQIRPVSPGDNWDWITANAFDVLIMFTALPNEKFAGGITGIFDNYGIVKAHIFMNH